MDISPVSRKALGAYGEAAACVYLRRRGFSIRAQNVSCKMGEIDIVAQKGDTLHIIEVKTRRCETLPGHTRMTHQAFHPADNLTSEKVRRVKRMGEWYLHKISWNGHVHIDGALVWVRTRDSVVQVSYLPQIL